MSRFDFVVPGTQLDDVRRRGSRPGVYCIWINKRAFYVGMSLTNCWKRIKSHLKLYIELRNAAPDDIEIGLHASDFPEYDELWFLWHFCPSHNAETRRLYARRSQ